MRSKSSIHWLTIVIAFACFFASLNIGYAETDVTNMVQFTKGRLMYDRVAKVSYLDVSLKNISDKPLVVPIAVIIESVTPSTVTVANASGYTADGKPYFDYSVADGLLSPVEATANKSWRFSNPTGAKFSYTASVIATGLPEAAAVIGPGGGVVEVTDPASDLYKVKIEVPQGATKNEVAFAISTVSDFSVDLPPLREPLVKINLSPNGSKFWRPLLLTIAYPDSDNDGFIDGTTKSETELYVYTTDEYGVDWNRLPVVSHDTEDNIIVVSCYHFSEVDLSTQQYASDYYTQYDCGVPDYKGLFKNKISATCSDKLDLSLYLNFVHPALQLRIDETIRAIDGTLEANEMRQDAIFWGGKIYSAVRFFSSHDYWNSPTWTDKEAVQLTLNSVSFMTHFTNFFPSPEYEAIADIWFNFAACSGAMAATGDLSLCATSIATTTLGMVYNAITSGAVFLKTEDFVNIAIARDYLTQYYSYGKDQKLMAVGLGLNENSSQYDIIDKVGAYLKTGWFAFDDYDKEEIINIINDGLSDVTNYRNIFDVDGDGYHNVIDSTKPQFYEFKVSTDGSYLGHGEPSVTSFLNGDFIVSYSANTGIFFQRYSSAGKIIGDKQGVFYGRFVNNYSDQYYEPIVASLSNGGFVVASRRVNYNYNEIGEDGVPEQKDGIVGQCYDSNGTKIGSVFEVVALSTNYVFPKVVSLNNGRFIVTWSTSFWEDDGSIKGQIFSSSGEKIGNILTLGDYFNMRHVEPALASLNDGGFLLSYDTGRYTNNDGATLYHKIITKRYDSSGNKVGNDAISGGSDHAADPSVTLLKDNSYIIAWRRPVGNSYGISVQRFNILGSPIGEEIQIGFSSEIPIIEPDIYRMSPKVSGLSDGGFILIWESSNQDTGLTYPGSGQNQGIYGQRFASDYSRVGSEIHVNTYTDYDQTDPQITATIDGGFIVTWSSYRQDWSVEAIFGKRFNANNQPVLTDSN